MRRNKLLIVVGLMMLMGLAASVRAEDMRPSWQCLPQQTMLVVRVPQPKKMVEQLRATTKFGKVVLSEARYEKLLKLWEQSDPDEWKEMNDELAKVGLKLEDLPHYLEGEFGFAMVGEKREGVTPLIVGMIWLDCGDELAGKLVEAIKTGVANDAEKDPTNATKRVDMELEGQPVMLLTQKERRPDWKSYQKEIEKRHPVNGFDGESHRISGQQMAPPAEDGGDTTADNDWPELKMIDADQQNTLVARMGGRVLLAFNMPNNDAAYFKKIEGGATPEQINFDELSGLQQMTGIFARFIAAHKGGEADYPAHLYATPGLQQAMPEGLSLVEVYGDLRPVWKMLNEDEMKEAMPVLQMLGIDTLTTGAMKFTLDGNVMRTGLFLSAPAPRAGLLALLDQPALPAEPAAWAPAHAMQYQRVSFDLGKAYTLIRQMVTKQYGDQASQTFQQIDASVQGMAQADLATVLSAMGSQIFSVSFEPRTAGKEIDQIQSGDLQRMALVWQLKDEALWQRMLAAMGNMGMGFLGDKLEQADEQGFTGWRVKAPETEIATMLGKGYLVMAIGFGVNDQVLNVLGNPPQGTDALAKSETMSHARALQELKPNLVFTVTNADMYIQALMPMIMEGMLKEMQDSDDENDKQIADGLKEVLPTREELKGMFGVSVSQITITDQGLVGHDSIEVPE